MWLAIVTGLALLAGWLAVQLSAAKKENADLRIRNDSLKRQLVRMR
jgi:hypothetical protein